jgi:hypothetical protein
LLDNVRVAIGFRDSSHGSNLLGSSTPLFSMALWEQKLIMIMHTHTSCQEATDTWPERGYCGNYRMYSILYI